MASGSWTSFSSTFISGGIAVCHDALPSFRLDQEAFVLCVHPVPSLGRATSSDMDALVPGAATPEDALQ